jgi:peptidoglycan hydrolase CwlO-like protein
MSDLRHNPRRVRLAGALAVLALALVSAPWFATPDTAGAAKPTPDGVFSIVRVKNGRSLDELQKEVRRVRAGMDRLKTEMAEVSADYAATRRELDRVGRGLVETRVELSRTQSLLDRQTTLVSANMTAMYKSGDADWLDVLARAGSFTELEADVRLLRLVIDEDRRAQRELSRLTEAVEDLEDGLAERRDRTLALEAELAAQKAVMADALVERRALLEGLTARVEEMLLAESSVALPAGLNKKPPKGGYTQLTWAKALLKSLRAPLTTQNLAAVVAWEMAEGGHWNNTAHYNPLNTTWKMPGATSMNSVGVKAYVSWAQGFKATLNTLHNGLYGGILAALRAGDDAQAVADAVAESPWGTHSFTVR